MTTTPEVVTKAPAFQKCPDTNLIAKRITAMGQGDFVSYNELNSIVSGRKLNGKDRHILDSARTAALKESKIVTECVTGEGLRRLTDEEISKVPQHTITAVGRKARRGIRKAECGDFSKMSTEGRKQHLAGLSALGAVSLCTAKRTWNMLENKVAQTDRRVPTVELVALFSERI